MNKSGALQITLSKPSSKQLAKIKEKLREHQVKNKQYNSMCYDIDQNKYSHSIIPSHNKQRKISKKEINHHSPAKLIRSKSKKIDCDIKKLSEEKVQKKNVQQLYSELMTIKSEYKTLKQSYNKLVVEKNDLTEREQSQKQVVNSQLLKYTKELEKQIKMSQGYQQQVEKIKRESYRLIENEKLKNKRLEETIQEKDLMIAFLRNQLQKAKRGCQTIGTSINQSSLIFLQNNPMTFNLDYQKSSVNASMMSNVIVQEHIIPKKQRSALDKKQEQDSLSFSRDKSKQMESISFLTNHDQTLNNLKKDLIIVQTHSSYSNDQQSQQCLTFQHRGLDETEPNQAIRNENKTQKTPLTNDKGKSLVNLPPKNGSKHKDFTKKIQAQSDQNSCVDSNKNSLDNKKYLKEIQSSRNRKNIASKKKKV